MKAQKWKIAAIVLAVVAGGASYTLAAVGASVDPDYAYFSAWRGAAAPHDTSPPDNQSIGWRFFVNKPIIITHVGLFDYGDNGLSCAHQMGIWGVGATVDLLRGPIDIGLGGTPEGHYVYVALDEPLIMDPSNSPYNRLLIGVWTGSGNTEELVLSPLAAVTFDAQVAGVITHQSYTLVGSPAFAKPWGYTEDCSHHFGVNFKYTLVGSNRPPVANNDDASTQINTLVTVHVLDNDSDPDGDALSIDPYTQGAHGTVTLAEGGLMYTPSEDFVGSDSFTYTINDGNGGTATGTVFVTVNPGTILIDIKPGGNPNSINLGSYGVVPVAILSTTAFDATTLDPDVIFLEGLSVAIRGKGNRYLSHAEDVNGDAIPDLVVQFDTENLDPDTTFQDGMATITVETTAEQVLYRGEDSIVIVPPAP